jgi:hypothetical protein
MNLETARNEIMHPPMITALDVLIEAVVFVVIATVTLQLIH